MRSERALILGAIKKSLRRDDERPSKPQDVALQPEKEITKGLDSLMFDSLQVAGGSCHRAESAAEVGLIIGSILEARNVETAIIAENEELKAMGIRQALAAVDVDVCIYPMEAAGASREKIKADFKAPDVGITPVFYGLAESGTMVLKGDHGFMRYGSLLPPIHVGVLLKDRLVYNFRQLESLLRSQGKLPSKSGDWMVFITGPSRTGDIEATLTLGVHGPREIHLILVG